MADRRAQRSKRLILNKKTVRALSVSGTGPVGGQTGQNGAPALSQGLQDGCPNIRDTAPLKRR